MCSHSLVFICLRGFWPVGIRVPEILSVGYFVCSESELIYSPLPGVENCGLIPPAGTAVGTRGHDGRCTGALGPHTEGSQVPLGQSL